MREHHTWLTEAQLDRCQAQHGVVYSGSRQRKEPIIYDTELYESRHLIERLFGKLKDWRRIATRYDRCAHTFYNAICVAATAIFWL